MNIPGDYKFKVQPFKYQIEGIKYGLNHNKWLLADQMGLGKSMQTINIADIREVKHCLIICCVNGLKWNWIKEVNKHSDSGGFILGQNKNGTIGGNKKRLEDLDRIDELPQFIITNIDTLKYRVPTGEKIERKVKGKIKIVDRYSYPITEKIQELCESGKINMIAVDEFHIVKNEDTEQARQILALHSPIQIAITGTPVMKEPLDIFMALKWLGYEDRTYWQFKAHYCRLGGFYGTEVVGYRNLEELSMLLDTIMLRRLKEEIHDLPDKTFVNEYVEMGVKQTSIYKGERRELLNNIDRIRKSVNPLTEFIRARQATGYTGILSNSIKVSAKFDRMEEIVDEAVSNGKKVVIFSNWTQIVVPAYKRLSQRHNGVVITGEVNTNERYMNIEKFCYDDNVNFIIGTIGAMGYGYDLISGEVVIFLDEPSDMETKNQAIGRCDRIGAKSNITIYTLICQGTIDERINHLVEARGEMSNILIDNDDLEDINAMITYLLS